MAEVTMAETCSWFKQNTITVVLWLLCSHVLVILCYKTQRGWRSLKRFQVFFLWRGPWKLLSSGMWHRVVWYIIVLKCQRNLLPPLSRLGADGSRRFLSYTSTGLERVRLQKALKLVSTIFFVLGAWMPGGGLKWPLNFSMPDVDLCILY
jgi:hypothetical protein